MGSPGSPERRVEGWKGATVLFPILPIVDLLILVGWSTLFAGALLKMIYLSTSYRPTLLGMTPMDCVLVAGVMLLFAVALAARTWVKANEPGILARRHRAPQNGAAGLYAEPGGNENARPELGETTPGSAAAGR